MKISRKILSIPPYISTSWDKVTAIHTKFDNNAPILVVSLDSGKSIDIPGLTEEVLKKVFSTHELFIEDQSKKKSSSPMPSSDPIRMPGSEGGISIGMPMNLGDLGSMGAMMQHNPEQSDAPPLPKEVVDKISNVSKAMGLDQHADQMPPAEPHCNCPYCQIARSLKGDAPTKEPKQELEEEVSDDDLKFKEWDIKQVGDRLYEVINPLEPNEHYQIFLGNPVGCTCGKKDCEHIKAVLKS